jgi:prefoldin subunit 5
MTCQIGRPFDIMKTLITTLTLCLATSLFAGDKEAELKKRIAGYDAKIAGARKELSELYAKQGALRKNYLALKRKQIEAKKAEIAKRRATLETKRKGNKKPSVKKPISKEEYLKRAAANKKAASAGKKGGTPYSFKAAAELTAAKKEYEAAQARLKKAIEAYNKSSGGKKK